MNETTKQRNNEIAERYTTLVKEQPLATPHRIICFLAGEYKIQPQSVRRVLLSMGLKTNKKETQLWQPQTI
jgi:hypothetical protein